MANISKPAIVILLLSVSSLSFSANKSKFPDCSKVDEIRQGLSSDDLQFISEIKKPLLINDILGFALDRESQTGGVYKEKKGKDFNSDILQLKDMAKSGMLREQIEADFDKYAEEFNSVRKDRELTKPSNSLLLCSLLNATKTELNDDNRFIAGYVSFLKSLKAKATGITGYFETTVNSCTTSKTLNTGNPYTNPTPDDDSRFLVVDATLKNIDREGRLPLAGSLIIIKNGVEYKYDTTETILLDGYGMKSINPLIKLRTKIVYRVPNEMAGDVYWKPGRNPDDLKLWCSHLSAVNP